MNVWNKSVLRPRVYTYTFYFLLLHENLSVLTELRQMKSYPDHMVDGVNVTITGIHPDGPQREAKLLS